MASRRALVIGGSIAGLLAANGLRAIGWEATVFERAAGDLHSRGAGLGTHRELVAVLERLGLPVDASVGVEVQTRICLDRAGRVTHRLAMPQRMSAWARIYRLLRDALPAARYRPGMDLVRVDQDLQGVTATFRDGTRAHADLLVAADGIRSTVRTQLLPEAEPRYAGYIAWRGLVDESAFPQDVHDEIFEHYAFCLPPGEIMLSYPVPGRNDEATPGRRGYNHIWYRPLALDGVRALCTDAGGQCHGLAIPPPFIRPEIIADMRSQARDTLAPQIAALVQRTEQPFFQAIFDLESPRMALGRVALAGDAAYVARPHVGMGVTKAALDAVSLIDALDAARGDVIEALRRYDARQRPFGAAIVAQARRMGAYLEAQLKSPEERGDVEREHRPEVVMRTIGSPLVDLQALRRQNPLSSGR